MSTQNKDSRKTILDIKKMKTLGEKITVLTAYDYEISSILDDCNIDMILVGDSLGMVVLGYDTTLPVRYASPYQSCSPCRQESFDHCRYAVFILSNLPTNRPG